MRGLEGVCGQFGAGGLNIFFGGRNSHQVLGSRRAGMAWKRAKKPEMGKNGKPNRKQPKMQRGEKGPKNGPKMEKPWKTPSNIHFFAIFCPCPPQGCLPFGFPFFPHFRFWPFSMPYQPGRIPNQVM